MGNPFDRVRGQRSGQNTAPDAQPPLDFDAGFDSGFDSDFDDSFDDMPAAQPSVHQPAPAADDAAAFAGSLRRRADRKTPRRTFTPDAPAAQPENGSAPEITAPIAPAPIPAADSSAQQTEPPAGFAANLFRRADRKTPRRTFTPDAPAAQPEISSAPEMTTPIAPAPKPAPAQFSAPVAPPVSAPVSGQPIPPAAPQPAPVPVSATTEEIMSVEGGTSIFGQLKAKVGSALNGRQKDDGIDYYTPPEGYSPDRIRYRTRNRRPLPIWLKSAMFSLSLLAVIAVTVFFLFFGTMISRVNFVDSKSHAPVRLTLDETAAMQAQLSEEVTNDITLPTFEVRTNENIQIILLVGVNKAIGSGDAGECDSIVLVAIDHEHDKIKLVSVARELYAQIPDYRNNMIGEAFFYDSASGNRTLDILRQALELNLCIKIDDMVSIDYAALQVIVNKLGGITMTVTNEEALYMSTHPKYGNFPRYNAGGLYTMTGAELLNYLRMRDVGDGTDAERVVRLRGVLTTLYQMVGATPAIDRTAAIYSVLPYITTDMSRREVYEIVAGAGRLADYELTGYSLPVAGSWGYDKVDINGKTTKVVIANYTFNAEYLQKFIYEDDLTYTYGNATNGIDIPYVSEEARAQAQAEANPEG